MYETMDSIAKGVEQILEDHQSGRVEVGPKRARVRARARSVRARWAELRVDFVRVGPLESEHGEVQEERARHQSRSPPFAALVEREPTTRTSPGRRGGLGAMQAGES